MTQTSGSSWLGQQWDKVLGGLDYVISDTIGTWSGQINQPVAGLGGNPYPEATPPVNPAPTSPGFSIGNNTPTYALGLGVLLLGFIVLKAVK